MRKWLTKVRISAGLDSGKPLPAALRHRISESSELEEFARAAKALDKQLRGGPSRPEVSPFLHTGIMRAVIDTGRTRGTGGRSFRLALLAGPAVALLLVCAWWLLHPAPSTSSVGTIADALNAAPRTPEAVAAAVVSPLSDELNGWDRDLQKAREFLLTSMP